MMIIYKNSLFFLQNNRNIKCIIKNLSSTKLNRQKLEKLYSIKRKHQNEFRIYCEITQIHTVF